MDHLKRALEVSDKYIEELETRVGNPEKKSVEMQEACGNGKAETETLTQQQKINMMMRSLSDNERVLICSNPEAECQTVSRNRSLVFMPSEDHKELNKNQSGTQKDEDLDVSSSDFLPSTPSSAFRSLTLRSPSVREKKVAFKTASYLRRIDFEEIPCPEKNNTALENQFSSHDKFPKGLPSIADVEPLKSVFWGPWQRAKTGHQLFAASSKESVDKESTPSMLVSDEPDSFHKSSEASMDAAFLNKISELDSMMLDGESSSSRGSQLSLASSPAAELENTLVQEPQTCSAVVPSCEGKLVMECEQESATPCDIMNSTNNNKEALKSFAGESCSSLVSNGESPVPGCEERGKASHTEELSFDLLFDPLEENTAGPSGSLSPTGQCCETPSSPSSSCTGKPVNTPRDRHTLNSGQPTKRKSHSPFNTSSPTKLSKLM